jgi:DNA-directed RNA polymerase specialized sigma24 family protein
VIVAPAIVDIGWESWNKIGAGTCNDQCYREFAPAMNARKPFSLDKASLDKLLVCLDADRERAGRKYETMRTGLIRFFEWRGSPSPIENADETLDRIARKVDPGEEIRDIHGYAVGVARFVFKEIIRERESERAALRDLPATTVEEPVNDARLECIKQCLQALPPESARLVMAYYRDDKAQKIERRNELARQLGVEVTTLRMRMQRLRGRLEQCAGDCIKNAEGLNAPRE